MFITTIRVLSFQPSRKAWAIRLKRTKPLLAVVEHFLRKVEGGVRTGLQARVAAMMNEWSPEHERVARWCTRIIGGREAFRSALAPDRMPLKDHFAAPGRCSFDFRLRYFGQDIGRPEQHPGGPNDCSVDVVGSHDSRPEIAADARRHANEHQPDCDQQPPVSCFEPFQ